MRKSSENEIPDILDSSPRFPGCEDSLMNEEEKVACATVKMMDYIHEHLEYPLIAQKNRIKGAVIIQFIVDEVGKIIDPQIIKDIGGGCAEELIRVIKTMNKLSEPWIPGTEAGEIVNMKYVLPIKFPLKKVETDFWNGVFRGK